MLATRSPFYPSALPTLPSPAAGDSISFRVDGVPPYKDTSFSIRNRSSPQHQQFLRLRAAAAIAMNGRAWTSQAVNLTARIRASAALRERHTALRFFSGIMDTLDGSHGQTFTFLPVVYEDDCQVVGGGVKWTDHPSAEYEIDVEFL